MKGRPRLLLAAAGAVVAIAVVVFAFRPSGDQVEPTGAAPTFSTADLAGRPVRLVQYRGEPVLLNFWASWCIPCRKEFPLLRAVHGHGLTVLGVVFNDSADSAAEFMKDQGASWPGLQDPGGDIAEAYHVGLRPGIPVSVLIDGGGRLVERHVGELRQGDLDRLVALVSATSTTT